MKRLSRGMLEEYDIAPNRPEGIQAVQFGADELLLGLADRLIDVANARGAGIGLALVAAGMADPERGLAAQDGLYTLFVRGEVGQERVDEERVIQCLTRVADPDADSDWLMALAGSGEIRWLLTSDDEFGMRASDDVHAALAARFLLERHRAGLAPVPTLVCGTDGRCAERAREKRLAWARAWQADPEEIAYLNSCRCVPSLAEGFVSRSDAAEAARLCREMNYQDAQIHLAEPFVRWTIASDEALRGAFPIDRWCPQAKYLDSLSEAEALWRQVADAALFAIAPLGVLRGDGTLAACMADEPLRERAGRALLDEALPRLPMPREKASEALIEIYQRMANPMQDNRCTVAAKGLLGRFPDTVLPVIRAHALEHGAPPEGLTMALSAAILLYAGAREEAGRWVTSPAGEDLPLYDQPEILRAFARLSPDMDSESLAYAALSDREIWRGEDLRDIDGLAEAVARNLA